MLDLGKPCIEGSWVVGAQLKPGTQTRLLIVGCTVGELDAEMSPAGKADNEHRLIDARKLNGPYRAAQDRLKALSQFPAPVRAHEDMHIAAKSDHDALSCRDSCLRARGAGDRSGPLRSPQPGRGKAFTVVAAIAAAPRCCRRGR
jgi:hypothetical protein